MVNFRLMFTLSLLCTTLALTAAMSHYQQLAIRWQKEAERTTEISRQQAAELVSIGSVQRNLRHDRPT